MIPPSNLDQLNSSLPPLDLSSFPENYNFMQSMDSFSNVADHDQPLFSAGLSSASIDWSHYDGLEFNNDNFASYSEAPSFTGFDFSSIDQPALTTTSTSGEISEVEDIGPLGDPATARPGLLNSQYGSDFDASDFGGDIDGYRLSTASSYIGLPQAQMLASNHVDGTDMDLFLKAVPTMNEYISGNDGLPASTYLEHGKTARAQYDGNNGFTLLSVEEENEAFWRSDFASSHIVDSGEALEAKFWAQ